MLHIKGRKTSGNVMKVTWILEELKIPYEREDVGGKFGKNDEQDYLDLNPMGLVPTLLTVILSSGSLIQLYATLQINLVPVTYHQSMMEKELF